jgi:sister-chromatid-cohesion protein PDS5
MPLPVSDFLIINALFSSGLAEALEAKLLDPDDKVRAAVCKMFSQLDYESVLHNVSEDLMRSVAGRFLDKKVLLYSTLMFFD